ncbi:MAG: sigma-70 family RNA polymerase sigma factor [Planctomycetes bacterium]|nr:sigma-70 family RNA polymerase sigma factor [Planctomycetota bacterium]
MSSRLVSDQAAPPDDASAVTDQFLMDSMLGGDAAALRQLMDRYDRLVRYTVFHCARSRAKSDPQWVDSTASVTWSGFVQSLRRRPDNQPQSVAKYLVRIARNSAVSELRKTATADRHTSLETVDEADQASSSADDPAVEIERIELIEALRGCFSDLGAEDRQLSPQLEAILNRRWREAAEALNTKESTLRSRWKRVLEALKRCVERKIGKSFAP